MEIKVGDVVEVRSPKMPGYYLVTEVTDALAYVKSLSSAGDHWVFREDLILVSSQTPDKDAKRKLKELMRWF